MSDSIRSRLHAIFAALTVATLTILPTPALAGPIDSVRKLAPSGSAELATPDAAGAGALKKFTAVGAVNETLDNGVCPNSYAATICTTPSDCAQIPITGSLTATGLGKSSFSGCLTVNNQSPDTPLADCFSGLGTGTITAKNGSSVLIAFGGDLCVADLFPQPTPTSAIFTINSSYAIESGTGKYLNAAGSGSLSASLIVTNVGTPPFSGSGTLNLTGSFAK